MKKIINVITLIVMLSVNIMTPFTYAEPLLDDFLETENFGEITQEDGVVNDGEKEEDIEKDQGNEDIFDTGGEENGEENDEKQEDLEDKDDMDDKSENDEVVEGNDEVVEGNDVDEKDNEDDTESTEDEGDIGNEVHDAAIMDDDRVIQEEFTVTFDANRGTFNNLPAPQTVVNGQTIPNLPSADPELPGYRFDGWFTASDDSGIQWDLANDVVTHDLDLYAHWTYNLTYGDLDVYMIKSDGTQVKYVMMDRNLGATDVYNKEFGNDNFNSFGYAYQWGNNYGFPRIDGNDNTYPRSDTRSTRVPYSDWQYKMPSKYASSTWVGDSSAKPNPWMDNSTSEIKNASKNLWGSTTNNLLARQGPCPDSYHLPTDSDIGVGDGILTVWADLYDKTISGSPATFPFASADQKIFTNQFLWPIAGTHKKGDNMEYEQRKCADYWASPHATDDLKARNIWFCIDNSGNKYYDKKIQLTNASDRNNGSSVRCFKNSTNSANLTIHPDKGTKGLISIHKLGNEIIINEIKEPERFQAGVGNLKFEGWYTDPDFATGTYKTGGSILSAQDTDLYAKWSCPSGYEYNGVTCLVAYEITFNANGGTILGESQDTKKEYLIYGVTYDYSDLPTPIRSGHVFKGWYAKFNGVNDYVDYGTDFKFNDKISIHLSARMDDWSEFADGNSGKRMISCLNGNESEKAGWAIKGKGKTKIQFACVDSDWNSATSDKLWSSLSSTGWHDFDVVFDGQKARLYLDGKDQPIGTSNNFSSGKLKYNSTNSILLGAQPGNSNTPYSADPAYFHGDIKDVIIQHSDQKITSTGVLLVPNQNVTYYALWEETDDYNVSVIVVPSTGGNVQGAGTYNELDEVTLTATANEGYQFTGWYDESDNFLTGSNPYIFTADASAGTGLKAVFELKQYTVSAQSNDENKGTITYPVGPYTHGMSIMFSPTVINPLLDKFLKWSLNGNDVLTGNNKFLTGDLIIESLTGNVNVIGYFTGYDTCLFNNQIIQHGESVTGYQSLTVPFGSECVSEIRTCNDGVLSGSYEYASCTPESASSCELPWGGTTGHGAVVTGYKTESETCPGECEGVSATCNNGSWSVPSFTGTYVKSGCITHPVEIPAEYSLDACPAHGICSSMTGYTVSENACVMGDVKVRLDDCDAHYHKSSDNKSCEKDKFDITWNYRDENGERTGNTIKVEYGEPAQEPSYPAVIWTAQTGYTFTGWEPEITSVTGPATYEAQYNETTRKYLITFVDGDGNTIQTGMVAYGTTPAYTGTEIPKKTSTAQTGYTFIGWSPAIHQVGGEETYTAQFEEWTRSYEITWKYKTETGSQIETGNYLYGAMPSHAGNDYQTAQTGYTFTGWEPEITSVTGPATYEAQYNETPREYSITTGSNNETWGSITVTDGPYTYGKRITFSAHPKDVLYKFIKWELNGVFVKTGDNEFLTGDLIIDSLTGDVVATGHFAAHNECNLPWGGTTGHGAVVIGYKEVEQTCPAQCSEVSKVATCNDGNWDVENFTGIYKQSSCTTQPVSTEGYELDGCPVNGICSSITGYTVSENVCVKGDVKFRLDGCDAHYHIGGDNKSCEKDKFDITWNYRDENGERTGNTIKVEYGEPAQEPSYPAVIWTVQTGYTFTGWEPEITSVTGPATYEAQYNETPREYLITFVDGDGNTIQTGMVAYGTTPAYTGTEIPKKTATAQYTYIFNNTWSPIIVPVVGTAIYTAQFDSIINKYTVIWQNEDGTELEKDDNVPYGTMPSYDGSTPIRPGPGSENFVFVGWNPTLSVVVGDVEYTAKYQAKKAPDDGGGGGQRRSGGGSHRLSPSDGIDQHGSAEEENKQSETEKESNIYKRAYKYGITTIDTEEIADPDGYVTRGHLAKMMVNFMVNVLGKDNPYDVSYQCVYWNDDSTEWESDEIREYATKACALGIMGINTRNNEFRPNDIVTRAEFGTVASRVLWGDRYNELDTDHNLFYTKHLKALQDGGFMNDIDNPLRRQEIRKWVWLVLKRIEEKNKK